MVRIRFKEVAEEWLEDKRNFIKDSTAAYYQYELEHYIKPIFYNMFIEDITGELIQCCVITWQKRCKQNTMSLKKSTIQNLITLLKQIIRFGIQKGYLSERTINIHYLPPNIIQKKDKIFSNIEKNKIINAGLKENNNKAYGILLALTCGLRIGEICALQWKDYDIENGIIHIRKTLQRIYTTNQNPKSEITITLPKTESSIRDVPLSCKMLEITKKFYSEPELFVLTNKLKFFEPRSYRTYYMKFLEKNNIQKLNFHCLRHTFATQCIENGADYKSISEIMGHSSVNTTINMYVHPQLENKRKCMELIQW